MKKIDAHAHLGYIDGWANVKMDADELISLMDTYEIETTMICVLDNEEAYKAMQKYPGRIEGCVYVNPLEPNCLDLIDQYVKLGFKAIKLQPLRHAYCADSEIVDPVLDKAEEYEIPVCIHSGHPPYSLPWQIGLLAERHPNCKVLMIHMGHGHGVYIDAALKMARRYPNIYLEMSGMPMHTKIKEAYDTVGHDRILFGTDGPFHHPTVEMQKVLMCGVDEQGLEDIFYNNAKKFFDV